MYGPAVRSRENDEPGEYGLASMYQASCWSSCFGPSWKSTRVQPYYRPCLEGAIRVISSRMRWKTFSPSLLFLSQTSVGNSDCRAHMTLLAMSADSRRLERGPERSDLEVATAVQDAPDDAGNFVGECRGLPPTCAALYSARQRVLKEGREPLSYTARDVLGAHYSPGWAVAPPWRASYK